MRAPRRGNKRLSTDEAELSTTDSYDTGIVFVHGILSTGATWKSLQHLVDTDVDLQETRTFLFEYHSPLRKLKPGTRVPDVDHIAGALDTYLRHRLANYTRIVLVGHSQGGLVIQRYLHRTLAEGRGRELQNIRLVVLFACPTDGSQYAATIRATTRWFIRNPQERELLPLNDKIAEARRTIINRVVNSSAVAPDTCPIPFFVYAGESDGIVSPQSARSVFPDAGVVPGNHSSIIKPTSRDDLSFIVLKNHIRLNLASRSTDSASGEVGPGPPVPTVDFQLHLKPDERNELIFLGELCDELPLPALIEAYAYVVGPAVQTDGLKSATSIIDRILDLGDDDSALPPLLQFALCLEPWTTSTRASLKHWNNAAAKRRQIDKQIVRTRRSSIERRHAMRLSADYLLIRVDDCPMPKTECRYLMSVELHRSTRLIEPLEPSGSDQALRLSEIRLIIAQSFADWISTTNSEHLVVEFLVPRHLLDEDFDRWPIVRTDRTTTLGVNHIVLVRDLDRASAPGEPSANWRRRWQLLNTSNKRSQSQGPYWFRGSSPITREQFYAHLLRYANGHWSCLAFGSFRAATLSALREVGLDLGAPAIMWRRECAPDEASTHLEQVFSSTPLPLLPAKLLDVRREAAEQRSNDHFGHFLSLLWDDPERMPVISPLTTPQSK